MSIIRIKKHLFQINLAVIILDVSRCCQFLRTGLQTNFSNAGTKGPHILASVVSCRGNVNRNFISVFFERMVYTIRLSMTPCHSISGSPSLFTFLEAEEQLKIKSNRTNETR